MRFFLSIPFTLCLASILVGSPGCSKKPDHEPTEKSGSDSLIVVPGSAVRSGQIGSEECRLVPLADTLVVTGEIQPDPLRVAHIASRVSGTVQSVATVLGTRVRRGEVVATLYSPEYQAAQTDFLLAHQRVERARAAGNPDVASLESIAQSSRRRLEVLGSDSTDVSTIHRTHEPIPYLQLRSPISGVVTEVEAAVGKQVTAGEDLFGMADLSVVWAVVHAYEQDLGRLHAGQQARVRANAYPGREFQGQVTTLEGSIEEETRTLKVRVRIDNSDLVLKPGLFVTARIATGSERQAIVLGEAAVQELDGVQVVFITTSDTSFVARPVRIRPLGSGLVEIVTGVDPGSRVAVQGAFLVKSQAKKRELEED
jgi:Cu(I)/Ag(I) efflux system membrane fusion protein